MEMNGRLSDRLVMYMPGTGRKYELGALTGIFYADTEETESRYCASSWWLEPFSEGPGPHAHEANEELFYVVEGMMTFQLGSELVDAPQGTFIRIPAGMTHDFSNRSTARAGVFNVFIPGGFEPRMTDIAKWYKETKRSSTQ